MNTTALIWNLVSSKLVATTRCYFRLSWCIGVTSTGNIVSPTALKTVQLHRLGDANLCRAIAPVRTLLEEEKRALQCARASTLPGAAAAVMFGILLDAAARRLRINAQNG